MNAIARRGQIDPHQTDRILRSRADGKLVFGFDAFEAEARVVMVGRIMRDAFDFELTAGRGLLGTAD